MEKLNNVITLYCNDKPHDFEFLDLLVFEGQEYVVLMPLEDPKDQGMVVILRVEDRGLEDTYVGVSDESVLNAVFALFRERCGKLYTFQED